MEPAAPFELLAFEAMLSDLETQAREHLDTARDNVDRASARGSRGQRLFRDRARESGELADAAIAELKTVCDPFFPGEPGDLALAVPDDVRARVQHLAYLGRKVAGAWKLGDLIQAWPSTLIVRKGVNAVTNGLDRLREALPPVADAPGLGL